MSLKGLSTYSMYKAGALDTLIEMGIIRSAIIEYCKIYEHYITYRAQGYNYTRAVEFTAEKLCLTESKVKVAIAEVI